MLLALLLGLVTALANLLGSYLAALREHPPRTFLVNSIAFGGGFLLAAALLEIVPESLDAGSSVPIFIALGYLAVYFGEQLFGVHLHQIPGEDQPDHDVHVAALVTPGDPAPSRVLLPQASLAILVAFNIHDFIDGLAIGAGMVASQSLGVLVFLAVLLHEVPAGFAIAAVMRGSGYGRRAAVLAGTSLGLITLVGIVIPFWIGEISSFATDALLALAGGSFIYMGASILIPSVETGHSRWALWMVGLGFVVFYLTAQGVGLLFPE